MPKSELQKQMERTAYVNKMLVKGYIFVPISELEIYKSIINESTLNKITSAILKERIAYLYLANNIRNCLLSYKNTKIKCIG